VSTLVEDVEQRLADDRQLVHVLVSVDEINRAVQRRFESGQLAADLCLEP
jgi:hypothetical protein